MSDDLTGGTTPRTGGRPGGPARTSRTTGVLLAGGIAAGPVYLLVSLAQALTRDGFDLARHPWSVLANGDLGWIQIGNLVLAGLLTIAFAAGARRVLPPGRGATWAPRLIGLYGAGLVASGGFVADPVPGFPPGTPEDAPVSWHGMMHLVAGGIGFAGLVAACLVVGAWFAAGGSPGWAWYSRVTGVLFAAGFVGVATGAGSAGSILAFGAAVVLAWAWLAALAARLHRRARS